MPTKQLNILVIDDNEDILFMIRAMLQHKGYQVIIKESPAEIERLIQESKADIILMDMLLSGADGREVCRQLKSTNFASIPLIMLSAHPQARKDCLAAGANYFIEKPFEMTALFETVENAAKEVAAN